MRSIDRLILLVLIVSLFGCDAPSTQEIKRLASPDKKVEAVLVERLNNATAPDSLLIYIVPSGKPVSGEPLFLGDKFYGLDFGWSAPRDLMILYAGGRIFRFSNFWQSSEVDNFRYTVIVHLAESNHPVFRSQ